MFFAQLITHHQTFLTKNTDKFSNWVQKSHILLSPIYLLICIDFWTKFENLRYFRLNIWKLICILCNKIFGGGWVFRENTVYFLCLIPILYPCKERVWLTNQGPQLPNGRLLLSFRPKFIILLVWWALIEFEA